MKEYEKVPGLKALVDHAERLKSDPVLAATHDAIILKEMKELADRNKQAPGLEKKENVSAGEPINKAKYMEDALARDLRDPNPEN